MSLLSVLHPTPYCVLTKLFTAPAGGVGAQGTPPLKRSGSAGTCAGARPLRSVAHGDTALPRGPGRLDRQPSSDLAEACGPIANRHLVAVQASFLLCLTCQALGGPEFCLQFPTPALEETTVRPCWATGRHPDVSSTPWFCLNDCAPWPSLRASCFPVSPGTGALGDTGQDCWTGDSCPGVGGWPEAGGGKGETSLGGRSCVSVLSDWVTLV